MKLFNSTIQKLQSEFNAPVEEVPLGIGYRRMGLKKLE